MILIGIASELDEAEGGGKDDYRFSISSNWVEMPFIEEKIRELIVWYVCVSERGRETGTEINFGCVFEALSR